MFPEVTCFLLLVVLALWNFGKFGDRHYCLRCLSLQSFLMDGLNCFDLLRFTSMVVFNLGNYFRLLMWRTCGLRQRQVVMLSVFSPGLTVGNCWYLIRQRGSPGSSAEDWKCPFVIRLAGAYLMAGDRDHLFWQTPTFSLEMLEAPSKNVVGCQNFHRIVEWFGLERMLEII